MSVLYGRNTGRVGMWSGSRSRYRHLPPHYALAHHSPVSILFTCLLLYLITIVFLSSSSAEEKRRVAENIPLRRISFEKYVQVNVDKISVTAH